MPDNTIFTPSRCWIDTSAISRNFQKLGDPARLMPVIKSDAYGHGLLPAAAALAAAGARRFAVGLASEGAALRQAGFNQDIVLLMGCLTPADWRLAIKERLMPIVGSVAAIQQANAACQPGETLQAAIKCDTGMGRLGFGLNEAYDALEALRQAPSLRPQMVISHLACADMPECGTFTRRQTDIFREFFGIMRQEFPELARCLGNSAATLEHLEDDISRPGLAIYGGNPFGPEPCGLEWAMSLSSPILHIHALEPGQSLSYGRIFTARQKMTVAVVACGYASGYARSLSNKSSALINGKRCPQLGRICMSMCMFDITGRGDARPGDDAWLMGGEAAPGQKAVDAWELAGLLNTIPYELLVLIGGMNPRIYRDA